MNKIKVIISAGGKGKRLNDLTGSLLPKSLVRLVDKPFIAYQLEQLWKHREIISNIYITFDKSWHRQLLKQSIRLNELPRFEYVIGKCVYGSAANVFREKNIVDFVGDNDFIWTGGDVFYSHRLIQKIINIANLNKTVVTTSPFKGKAIRTPMKNDNGYTFTLSQDNRLLRRLSQNIAIRSTLELDTLHISLINIYHILLLNLKKIKSSPFVK